MSERLRREFQSELDQLRLQVEVMVVRVEQNLGLMCDVLERGDPDQVGVACRADDEIDAMNVSLTERCYLLLQREAPVASDLRFIVSVLRIIAELERIGDLSLRVVKLAPDQEYLAGEAPEAWKVLRSFADATVVVYRLAVDAWSAQDLEMAAELAGRGRALDEYYSRLVAEVLALQGPDAVRVAMAIFSAGRALERIADHSAIVGARLRYLLTGEPAHLVAEVR